MAAQTERTERVRRMLARQVAPASCTRCADRLRPYPPLPARVCGLDEHLVELVRLDGED